MQNNVVSGVLTTATNWVVMEFCIDKNWKLENWIEEKKKKKQRPKFLDPDTNIKKTKDPQN